MSESTKQRKKIDKGNGASSSFKPGDETLKEQLDRAQNAVERNHESAQTLHQQWRTQLLRMGYVVMVVLLHMSQGPSSACIKDIKSWNELHPSSSVPGGEAINLVLGDSVVELLSILCVCFLVWCLSLPNTGTDFATIPYRLSCAVLPMIIRLYFQRKSDDQAAGRSCIAHLRSETDGFESEATTRHFPVVVIFHLMVSISLWFMHYQNQQHAHNIQMVQKLKKDLEGAKKEKVEKKKR